MKSIKRDRFVSRRQMYHCCINLRSLKEPGLVDGLSFITANYLLRVMDDGSVVLPWNFAPNYNI